MQYMDYYFRFHKQGDHGVVYEISDKDVTDTTQYFGYVASNGSWIIMAWDTVADTFRYCAGQELYIAAWTGRDALDYVYYYQL